MFSFLGRLIKKLIILAVFAFIGGTVTGSDEGAVIGAGLVLAYWILRTLFRTLFGRKQKYQLATIVDISNQAPPGAPWYYHTYVLFDIKGKASQTQIVAQTSKILF